MIRKTILIDLDTDWNHILPPNLKVFTDEGGEDIFKFRDMQYVFVEAEGSPAEVAEVLMMYNESTYTSLDPFTVIPR